jgi:cell division protein FtsQ
MRQPPTPRRPPVVPKRVTVPSTLPPELAEHDEVVTDLRQTCAEAAVGEDAPPSITPGDVPLSITPGDVPFSITPGDALPSITPRDVPPSITARARHTVQPTTSQVVLAQAADRFAERRRMRRWRVLRWILVGLGTVATVAGLVWLLFFSTALVLDPAKIVVEGEGTTVDPVQVTALAEPWSGTQLARIDTGALRNEILTITTVKDVRVSRAWPNGLHIALTSREPVVAVAEEGQFFLYDEEAVHVGTAEELPPGITLMSLPTDLNAETLDAARTVLADIGPDLAALVVEIGANDPVTVWFELADGQTVQWGSATENELKLAVLQALRAAPESAGARVIDVTTPTAPIVS